ncbi:uncharacterized protein LOC141730868 isoform X2 [Zonotrichia albicollis]|uniref:uncharacterized protein LOC141730868 isoform X2 n=1 Tax=Zonotrichia albicollis TaxID=44394 RepID=UPI003D8104A3
MAVDGVGIGVGQSPRRTCFQPGCFRGGWEGLGGKDARGNPLGDGAGAAAARCSSAEARAEPLSCRSRTSALLAAHSHRDAGFSSAGDHPTEVPPGLLCPTGDERSGGPRRERGASASTRDSAGGSAAAPLFRRWRGPAEQRLPPPAARGPRPLPSPPPQPPRTRRLGPATAAACPGADSRCAGRARPCPAHVALPPPPSPARKLPRTPHAAAAPLRSAPPASALRLAPPPGPAHKAHTPLRRPPAPLRAALPTPNHTLLPLPACPSQPPHAPVGTSVQAVSPRTALLQCPAAPRAPPPRHQLRSWLCRCPPGTDAAPLPPAHRAVPRARVPRLQRSPARGGAITERALLATG